MIIPAYLSSNNHEHYVLKFHYPYTSEGDYTKRFCRGKDTTTKLIDVEEKEGLYYDITVNSYGEVTSLKVSDDTFGLTVSNSNGIKKKSIKQSDVGDSF